MKVHRDIYILPLVNYIKFVETNDYKWFADMNINEIEEHAFTNEELEKCKESYSKLIFQFDEVESRIEKLNAKYMYNCLQYELTNNAEYLNKSRSDLKKLEAEMIKPNVQYKTNFGHEIALISKWLGYQINRNTMSLGDYFDHRKNYMEYCKANSK